MVENPEFHPSFTLATPKFRSVMNHCSGGWRNSISSQTQSHDVEILPIPSPGKFDSSVRSLWLLALDWKSGRWLSWNCLFTSLDGDAGLWLAVMEVMQGADWLWWCWVVIGSVSGSVSSCAWFTVVMMETDWWCYCFWQTLILGAVGDDGRWLVVLLLILEASWWCVGLGIVVWLVLLMILLGADWWCCKWWWVLIFLCWVLTGGAASNDTFWLVGGSGWVSIVIDGVASSYCESWRHTVRSSRDIWLQE